MSQQPNYAVVSFDLATARTDQPVAGIQVGTRFDSVTVLALPAGAGVSVRFGSNQHIPLSVVNQSFRLLDSCEHPFFCDEGLFVTNPAGAGVCTLLVSLGTTPSVGTP